MAVNYISIGDPDCPKTERAIPKCVGRKNQAVTRLRELC